MNILIVEDDPNKSRQISDFIRSNFEDCEVAVMRSYSSGLKRLREQHQLIDLVLLDMSLPNFDGETGADGGRFRSYGGREIIQQVSRRGISVKILVVTQYDAFSTQKDTTSLQELDLELSRDFPEIYIGFVYYSASENDWKARILSVLESIN